MSRSDKVYIQDIIESVEIILYISVIKPSLNL